MFQLRGLGTWAGVSDGNALNYCKGRWAGYTAAQYQTCANIIIVGQSPLPYMASVAPSAPTISTQPTSTPPVITFPSIPGVTTQNPTPGTTVVTTPATAGFFAPGWYTTLPGLALIAAAGFVGYKVYTRKKPTAA